PPGLAFRSAHIRFVKSPVANEAGFADALGSQVAASLQAHAAAAQHEGQLACGVPRCGKKAADEVGMPRAA
ncbi:hypothetical protein, partial [Escherichia coli]|uniref:hypothetical protein n=1 Tax=Escherichia coli TaxID=562 RepID=UPI003CE5790A